MEGTAENQHEREEYFQKTLKSILDKGVDGFVEYSGEYSKAEFLAWLVSKGYLLHGSNNLEITELQPHQANDASKDFGNMNAVYAVEDPILPIFYAIQNHNFTGYVISEHENIQKNGKTTREYSFEFKGILSDPEAGLWSDGAVYILPKKTFIQGKNDIGEPENEWASKLPVVPLGKIKVSPQDFPYIDKVKITSPTLEAKP